MYTNLKNICCILIIILSISCTKNQDDSAVYYRNINKTISVASPMNGDTLSSAMEIQDIDINNDGITDYTVMIEHAASDSVYHFKDEYLIIIGSEKFNLVSIINPNKGFARIYSYGDNLQNDFDLMILDGVAINIPRAYLYKTDDIDTYKNLGKFYIGLKMFINNKAHYGWASFEIQDFKITIKEMAINKTADKMISIGQKD